MKAPRKWGFSHAVSYHGLFTSNQGPVSRTPAVLGREEHDLGLMQVTQDASPPCSLTPCREDTQQLVLPP